MEEKEPAALVSFERCEAVERPVRPSRRRSAPPQDEVKLMMK
jgi:hypothetical protein